MLRFEKCRRNALLKYVDNCYTFKYRHTWATAPRSKTIGAPAPGKNPVDPKAPGPFNAALIHSNTLSSSSSSSACGPCPDTAAPLAGRVGVAPIRGGAFAGKGGTFTVDSRYVLPKKLTGGVDVEGDGAGYGSGAGGGVCRSPG